MKNLLFVFFVSALLLSCGNKNNESKVTDLDINSFTDEAANYVDQNVSITGTCVHICKHGGKKMHLIGDNDEKKLVVFTGEGVSEFPMELEGLIVKVTGKVVEEVITEETILEWEAADAKDKAEAEAEAESDVADVEADVEMDVDVIHGENVEINVENADILVDGEVIEDVTLEADLKDIEEVELETIEEESHACKEDNGDPYAKFRQQIAESQDGKLRMYYIEVSSFEEVK